MKQFIFALIVATVGFGFSHVYAMSIQNNGAGSQNSVYINNGSSTTIQQGSTLQIQNNVNSSANTGNNTASGNNGGNTTIKTGDATTKVNVTNNGNSNTVVSTPCCTTPSPTKNPTGTPKPNPTTTPDPGDPGSNNGGSSNSSSNSTSSSSAPQAQGEILGLANTASTDVSTVGFTALGVLCLAIGSALLIKNGFLNG